MDELRKISPVPTVRPAGPSTPLKTLGDSRSSAQEREETKPAAANDSAASPTAASTQRAVRTRPPKLTLKLSPSSAVGPHQLPPAAQGEPYERLRLECSGGAAPYRFRFLDPQSPLDRSGPPRGLKLSQDGVLSGEPTRAGCFRFTIEVVDADGALGRAEYEIAVRLDLSRYKCVFDPSAPGRRVKRRRAVSEFDPDEIDVDGQPVYPLGLAEFLAYKSAQAYLRNDPLDPRNALGREIKLSHPSGDISRFAFFDSNRPLKRYGDSALKGRRIPPPNKAPDHWEDYGQARIDHLNEWRAGFDAQGFGFVFEGRTYIICRGATSVRDWRVEVDGALTTDEAHPNTWWENVKFRTGMRGGKTKFTEIESILIGGPDPERYLRPARAAGFAAAWASIRDQIENWLATLPSDSKREFVFAGHGLGGAMAVIGAQEFVEKRDRKIHAVVTFGAPCVGKSARSAKDDDAAEQTGDHFADNYRTLQNGELDRRTLRIETDSDALPQLLLAKNFDHVGRLWRLEFEPLPSAFTRFTRRYLTGPLLWLARGSFGYENKDLSLLPRKSLGYVAFSGLPLISSAVGGQAALNRYANYFSTLTYRKIREAKLGDLEDPEAIRASSDATVDHYYLCNALYDQHLTRIYAPRERRRFTPRYICDGREEARLAKRYYGADAASYIF